MANTLQLARIVRRLRLAGDPAPLTPQELEMIADLQALGTQTDEYLTDAVSVARWADDNR
jgi:hypothetical protein